MQSSRKVLSFSFQRLARNGTFRESNQCYCHIRNALQINMAQRTKIHTDSDEPNTNFRRHTLHKYPKRFDPEQLILSLSQDERESLNEAMKTFVNGSATEEDCSPPSLQQLRLVALSSSIPFIGFGFLDNAIMIAAGEYIDVTIGVMLGISTMAAAAIGNMISDIAGIGLAGYVEALASRLGMEGPSLTPQQLCMPRSRVANYLGRAVGIAIGCIVGMFPLFFTKARDDSGKTECEKNADEKS